jgi:phosphoglycerol transferase MdoB-like AlkP superfamily enzyme
LPLTKLSNLVVIQSESFFDVRGLCTEIRTGVLREFDIIKASAVYQGQLKVPAWGANTVRTEFAFLSGLEPELLRVHRFNPYRKLARQGIPTLASFLKRLGYHTVCVHPYQAGFYARDKVFPLLGFDEFIDIRSFVGIEKTGPYVGDVALAEKVCALLKASSNQPLFVFVITMENHGPLHFEKVQESDVELLYSCAPPEGCDDLTVYLRHLRNADRMAGMLRAQLDTLPGSGWLCWYGDHVPIMPKVYRVMGVPDGQTDYLIWKKGGANDGGNQLDLKIENLGYLLLKKMGMVSSPD